MSLLASGGSTDSLESREQQKRLIRSPVVDSTISSQMQLLTLHGRHTILSECCKSPPCTHEGCTANQHRGKDRNHLEKDLLDSYRANVIGNIDLFNLFMPFILEGNVKKVIAISSALADIESTSKYDLDHAAPYAINKAALNAAVAKFSSQYRKEGVLFMSICPGSVATQSYDNGKFPAQDNRERDVLMDTVSYRQTNGENR